MATAFRARGFSLLGAPVAVIVAWQLFAAHPAAAVQPCDTSWVGGSGLWSAVGSWTNGIPDASDPLRDQACITVAGTYTVTLVGSWSAGSLNLGGATGVQTLAITGTLSSNPPPSGHAHLTLTGQDPTAGIGVNGVILFTSSAIAPASSNLSVQGGTLTNRGSITSAAVAGVDPARGLNFGASSGFANLGTLSVNENTSTNTGSGTTLSNSGTIQVAAGKTWDISNCGGPTPVPLLFQQTAGTITATGLLRQSCGRLAMSGGTATGTPILLRNVEVSPTAGTATIDMESFDNKLGSDIGTGFLITVRELPSFGGSLKLLASHTNRGTIRLECCATTLEALNPAILTNEGTIHAVAGGADPRRFMRGYFVNNGTVDIDAQVEARSDPVVGRETRWTNSATIDIAPGASLTTTGSFTMTAGTLTNSGAFYETGPSVYTQTGGTITGNPLFLIAEIDIRSSGGSATLAVRGGGNIVGTDVGPGITLLVGGGPVIDAPKEGFLEVPMNRTNGGTIRLETTSPFVSRLNMQGGAVLTNQGSLDVRPGAGGDRSWTGAIANAGTGTTTVAAGATFVGASASASYTQSAGMTVVNGTLNPAGAVQINGGVISGTGTVAPGLTSAGEVRPGSSPGVLRVSGNYTQTSAGKLTVELNGLTVGSGYDRLEVTGTTSLAGTLQIVTGMTQTIGNTFDVMTFSSRTGTFSTVTGKLLPGGKEYRVNSRATTIRIAVARSTPADFDGDGDTDISVFRPSSNTWFVRNGPTLPFGLAGDIPVPCDYDGNGTTDVAVFRPSNGGWYISGQTTQFFGLNGDVPVPGDYDGDGRCDVTVFRASVGGWYVKDQPTVFFGLGGDIPVPADYDGNGTTDVAVYRPSVGGWYRAGTSATFFGLNGDIPVAGDYDGNGTTDVAIYRPGVGGWYVNGQATQFLGLSSDIPVPGDYDGNGTTDRAVFRPGTGTWYVGAQAPVSFGLSGDRPLPLPSAIRQVFFP